MNKKAADKVVVYRLINDELHRDFGKVSFNGKFVFELDADIDLDTWQQIGIIPIQGNSRKIEVNDLFYYLNSRLPQRLRKSDIKEKLKYIDLTGLKVASDNFRLEPVSQ